MLCSDLQVESPERVTEGDSDLSVTCEYRLSFSLNLSLKSQKSLEIYVSNKRSVGFVGVEKLKRKLFTNAGRCQWIKMPV